jgi:hypothetical protein
MFLTPSEVERLTGKKRHSAQIRWLRAKGYKIDVNGLGEPILAIAEYNRKSVGGSHVRFEEPDWGALNGSAS